MDWTLTIDRTWVLHFSDQLFNCYNLLTVSHLEVKPDWSLSATVALRRLIVHAVVAVSCVVVCGLQASSATPSPSTAPALLALPPSPPQPMHYLPSPPPPTASALPAQCSVLLLLSAPQYCAECNNRTLVGCGLQQ